MRLVKKLAIIMVILIAAVTVGVIFCPWPEPFMIPSTHVGRVTCFECHETGVGGAPQFPSGHQEKTDNINECLKCHKREGS